MQGNEKTPEQIHWENTILFSHIRTERKQRMLQVLQNRTQYITVVLENIYQPHNASAVLRSCEAFGIQNVHIIDDKNPYTVNSAVSLGSAQWLTLHRYTKEEEACITCIRYLQQRNYRIVATHPAENGTSLQDISFEDGPIALVFGSEKPGISAAVQQEADEFLYIPTCGFVESLNISVAAAIILHMLTRKLYTSALPWQITQETQNIIINQWLLRSVKNAHQILANLSPHYPHKREG